MESQNHFHLWSSEIFCESASSTSLGSLKSACASFAHSIIEHDTLILDLQIGQDMTSMHRFSSFFFFPQYLSFSQTINVFLSILISAPCIYVNLKILRHTCLVCIHVSEEFFFRTRLHTLLIKNTPFAGIPMPAIFFRPYSILECLAQRHLTYVDTLIPYELCCGSIKCTLL